MRSTVHKTYRRHTCPQLSKRAAPLSLRQLRPLFACWLECAAHHNHEHCRLSTAYCLTFVSSDGVWWWYDLPSLIIRRAFEGDFLPCGVQHLYSVPMSCGESPEDFHDERLRRFTLIRMQTKAGGRSRRESFGDDRKRKVEKETSQHANRRRTSPSEREIAYEPRFA